MSLFMGYVPVDHESIDFLHLSERYKWQPWAVSTLYVLSALVLVLLVFDYVIGFGKGGNGSSSSSSSLSSSSTGSGMDKKTAASFRAFQWQYLAAYLLIMLADWLQGTNMYTLYSSYAVDVGLLFQTGFLSSAIFGTFLGIYVDKWGRRMGCIVFCLLEIIINYFEHFNNMPLLIVGRIMGGMSTSLLFSAFESWMVSEHRKKGFPEELISQTNSFAASGNGLVAILAGLAAQRAADVAGDIGPFQLAIALTVVVLGLVLMWGENYGTSSSDTSASGSGVSGLLKESQEMCSLCRRRPDIWCLGVSQAFFEGAVYSFVFMWVPSLQAVSGDAPIPTGLVFSCFMLAMTCGGFLSSALLPLMPQGNLGISIVAYLVSSACMLAPVFNFSFGPVFVSFLLLECMVGMFNSAGATLRSEYYPEGSQSSIISIFRLPLNLLVFYGTSLANSAGSNVAALKEVFMVLSGMFGISVLLLGYVFCTTWPSAAAVSKKKN
jgi:MFS family permease